MTIKRFMIRDFIWAALIVVLWILFNFNFFTSNPVHVRGWFRHDTSISLPYTGAGSVPSGPLTAFGFGMPVVALIAMWVFFDKIFLNNWKHNDIAATNDFERLTGVPPIHQTPKQRLYPLQSSQTDTSLISTSPTSPTTPIPPSSFSTRGIKFFVSDPHNWAHYYDDSTSVLSRKIRFAIYQFFTMLIAVIFCILVTTSLKYMVGRLRPDFLDRCKPDYSNPALVIGQDGWIGPEYAFICTGDKHRITGGRESFPSGHSSSSLTASTYVAWLLWLRAWNRCQRSIGFVVVPFLMMAVVCGGLLIATSRSWDNRHHFFDIFTGCFIGIICGSIPLLFPYAFTPTWELDGTIVALGDDEEEVLLRPSENRVTSSGNSPVSSSQDSIQQTHLDRSDQSPYISAEMMPLDAQEMSAV